MVSKIHSFNHSILSIPLPEKFTFPFNYTPHPLCVLAAQETQEYLKSKSEWAEELQLGKMFGVLVIRDHNQKLGFLAAFSGNLMEQNEHSFFVPPIYDLLQPEGFFKIEEDQISAINRKIHQISTSLEFTEAKKRFQEESENVRHTISQAKESLKVAKKERDILRKKGLSSEEEANLIKESQFQKAELKRLERSLKESIETYRKTIDSFDFEITRLKHERKTRSAALQMKLFKQFLILNAKGEVKDLCEIFAPTSQKVPPAGAGECAAPKLLQYAFMHELEPIAMAEFWWGNSPKTEIRHHGYYYPACKSKCEPILGHMLQGLKVEENPLLKKKSLDKLEVIFEDEAIIIINKPAGVLSVPGKNKLDSVYQQIHTLYPQAIGPLLVHRLDMATSGLLIAAKTKDAHKNLQLQFENQSIEKKYIAVLDGEIKNNEGIISLPLCLDPLDRPRQIVSEKFGKPAITHYKIIEKNKGKSLIAFYPQTGRTHQLRVHAAHPLGLNCPIVGDELYGKKADRLYLHAEQITFTHPITNQRITVRKECPFSLASFR